MLLTDIGDVCNSVKFAPNVQCRFFNEVKFSIFGQRFDGSGSQDGQMRVLLYHEKQKVTTTIHRAYHDSRGTFMIFM